MAVKSTYRQILKDQRAATAVEYGLLVGLMALAAMTGMTGFSSQVKSTWDKVNTTLSTSSA